MGVHECLNWSMTNIQLMKGDCLERMKEIPDKSVDMILTDPPYGTTACKWDAVIPFKEMWSELKRISKESAAIVMTASQPFTSSLVMSNPKGFKHSWVWHKLNAGNVLTAKYSPLKTTEDVLVFTAKGEAVKYFPILSYGHKDRSKDKPQPKKTDLFGGVKSGMFKPGNNKPGDARYPKHLIEFSNAGRVGIVHPTQKPVALLEYLIKTYTLEGETVLDFTMGSGSTGVACKNTGRNFIGIERDDKYFEIAKNRIENA
jgi:site-specific DNA-methyltransferase (adenine-specific)